VTAFWLRLAAPFAAWRPLQPGSYRATTRCLPPSAAYGLVLGLAGVDMRDPAAAVCTGIRAGLPALRLALGQVGAPEVAVLFQQLHGYGPGPERQGEPGRGHGAKTWIGPVRREVLVGFEAILAVEADEALAEAVLAAAAGRPGPGRRGLPFAGDNNLLFDHLEGSRTPLSAHWLTPLGGGAPPRPQAERLTVWIDRADSARTRRLLMAPLPEAAPHPPPEAWLDFPGDGSAPSPRSDASGR